MYKFGSKREKKLWIWVFVVIIGIYSTLAFNSILAHTLREHGIIGLVFWIGLILIFLSILINGLRLNWGRTEFAIILGVAGVYIIVCARMYVPEARSHIIEYSVLAILILEALRERIQSGINLKYPALIAIGLTFAVGVFDECIQYFLPMRVFDWFDILFNFLAAVMGVGASVALNWARQKVVN